MLVAIAAAALATASATLSVVDGVLWDADVTPGVILEAGVMGVLGVLGVPGPCCSLKSCRRCDASKGCA